MKLLFITAALAAALVQPLEAKPNKKDGKAHRPAPARTAPHIAAHAPPHPQQHAQAHPKMHVQAHPKAYAHGHPKMPAQHHPKAYAQTHPQGQHFGKSPKTWEKGGVANNRSFQKPGRHGPSIAFGGNSSATAKARSQSFSHTEINYSRPPETVYRDWDHSRVHSWDHHNYRWYGNTWVIIDGGSDAPYYYGPDSAPGPLGYADDVAASVQESLARRGYDPGTADGVIGPQTRNAIAAFQEDRGLVVTGRIDRPLLRALGL